MPWPNERLTTYNPGASPVKANDLNEIQDAIIARRHGALEFAIHPSKVEPAGQGSNNHAGMTADGAHFQMSAPGKAFAAIELPVGSRLLSIRWYYNRNGLGSITPSIKRQELATAAVPTLVVAGPADAASAGVQNVLAANINHVILSGWAYFVEWESTAATMRVHGALITFDKP